MAENTLTAVTLKSDFLALKPGEGVTLTASVTRGSLRRTATGIVVWGADANTGRFEAIDSEFTSERQSSSDAIQDQAITIDDSTGTNAGRTRDFRIKFILSRSIEPDLQSVGFTADVLTLKRTPTTRDEFMTELAAAALGSQNLSPRLASTELELPVQPPDVVDQPQPVQPITVQLSRTQSPNTDDEALWSIIRLSTQALSFNRYDRFIDEVLCLPGPAGQRRTEVNALARFRSLPFPDTDPYRLLKVATEVFMQLNCGVFFDDAAFARELKRTDPDFTEENLRLGRSLAKGELEAAFARYFGDDEILPYLELVRRNLRDWDLSPRGFSRPELRNNPDFLRICDVIVREKLTNPCFVELIWSYWHEESMLVQAMKAISIRFQNRHAGNGASDPLAHIEIDPLRPLNNFLWGYIQDEDHRLTVPRRAYEYDHHYGVTVYGKAVPRVRGADSRSRFIEAFHNLLYLCGVFFRQDDDTTVVSDGFPILNALREVHLLLTQGAHNQYLDLPWTARQEMLMEEWILARPEFREFLPYRIMVDYPEAWMHSVEAMKALQGWNMADVLHFRDLGITGERILLGARFGSWTTEQFGEAAKNWARYFRTEIQRYVHAYRAVTGVDLMDHFDATMPAVLLRQRHPHRAGAQVTPVPPKPPVAMAPRPAPRALGQPGIQSTTRELAGWSEFEEE